MSMQVMFILVCYVPTETWNCWVSGGFPVGLIELADYEQGMSLSDPATCWHVSRMELQRPETVKALCGMRATSIAFSVTTGIMVRRRYLQSWFRPLMITWAGQNRPMI